MPDRLTEDYTLELAEQHIGNLNGNVDRLGEALTQNDTDLVPNTPTAGSIQFSSAGDQKYVSSDGNAYNTGRMTLGATGSLSLTTSLTTVPGLSAPLAVGTYRVNVQFLVNAGASGGQLSYRIQGTGGLTASNGRSSYFEVTGGSSPVGTTWGTLGTTFTGSTPGAGGNDRLAFFQAYYVISVAGTINAQAAQAATANSTILQYGTFMEIMPVS